MDTDVDLIRQTAEGLRTAVERAQAEGADIPWLARFPENCCNFVANLLLLDLSAAGVGGARRMIGKIFDDRENEVGTHVWVSVGDLIVDISADHYGQPPVIAQADSAWHASLREHKPFIERIDLPEGVSQPQLERLAGLYKETLDVLSPFRSQPA